MANSKFSGVAFLTGANATANSSFAGIESTGPGTWENRRWTIAELAAGLPAASVPPLPDVLSAGYTANSGQVIALTTGATVTTYGQPDISCGGAFEIVQGSSNILNLGNISSTASSQLRGGAGTIQVGSVSSNVVVSSTGTDDIQLNIQGTGDISMYLGTAIPAPAIGDVLAAKTTGGALEWKNPDPKAFQTLAAGANATWIIEDGYNASWNVGTGSVTLTITCSDGDSGTLIVTTTTGEITWPAGSLWTDGGTEPTLTNGVDVFSFVYDGTNYYWSYGQDFA